MQAAGIPSDSLRALEQLIKEKGRKPEDFEAWAREARGAFAVYLKEDPPPNTVFRMTIALGPRVSGATLAAEWERLPARLRGAIRDASREPRLDVDTLSRIAEGLLDPGMAPDALELVAQLTSRCRATDRPDSLAELRRFFDAGGLERTARLIRRWVDDPEGLGDALRTVVELAERLSADGGKRHERSLRGLRQAIEDFADDERGPSEAQKALAGRIDAALNQPPRQRREKPCSPGKVREDRQRRPGEDDHRGRRTGQSGLPGGRTADAPSPEGRRAKAELADAARQQRSAELVQADVEAEQTGQKAELTATNISAVLRSLGAWFEATDRKLDAVVGAATFLARIEALESGLLAVRAELRRERADQEDLLATAREERAAAHAAREEAVSAQRMAEVALAETRAELNEERKRTDHVFDELPRQRVREFKRRLEGKLGGIVAEVDASGEGVDPAHHLEVVLGRWRALRDILVEEGILNA